MSQENNNKDIFVFIGQDRHIDVQVEPFSTLEKAVERCKKWIAEAGYINFYEEENIEGYVYSASYGVEGDYVDVIVKQIKG